MSDDGEVEVPELTQLEVFELQADTFFCQAEAFLNVQVEVVPCLLRALYYQNLAIIQLMKEQNSA